VRNRKLILASASPRRAELLREAGGGFEVRVSPVREASRKPAGVAVEVWPACLAYAKAAAVWEGMTARERRGAVVLGADTIVVVGERILNKAASRGHARRMLESLSGRVHRVITGICLLGDGERQLSFAEATCRIHFTAAKLEAYLDSGLWRGKAGAYGIQDKHDPFITLLDGDVTTVIGLPMFLVKRELAGFGKGAA
jgi:septum formation protein